jgi:DNA-binding CsgD family transcriptional regulator
MGTAMDEVHIFERLTLARVRMLRELGEGYTATVIADRLGMTVNGVRSAVDDLRDITGIAESGEIGRWWRKAGGPSYIAFLAGRGGS